MCDAYRGIGVVQLFTQRLTTCKTRFVVLRSLSPLRLWRQFPTHVIRKNTMARRKLRSFKYESFLVPNNDVSIRTQNLSKHNGYFTDHQVQQSKILRYTHKMCLCISVQTPEHAPFISIHDIKRLIFINDARCVYRSVRTEAQGNASL